MLGVPERDRDTMRRWSDDIARSLLAHPAVRAVRVSSEKPDVYSDVDAVGVEVLHFKDAA